jgi:ABC-type branched-subunit amino acid transport system ATPase component
MIIGPNGSGKTTTLNLISGILRPREGIIELDGEPIAGLPPERIALAGLTRTFQNGRVFGNATVRENILVGLTPRLRQLWPLRGLRLRGVRSSSWRMTYAISCRCLASACCPA